MDLRKHPTFTAIFQSILDGPQTPAHPAELDATYHAYADYLEEFGETPADFARGQLVRTALALESPNLPHDERDRLLAEQTDLQQQVINSLGLQAAGCLAAIPCRITFHKGLIKELLLGYTYVSSLEGEWLHVTERLSHYATALSALPPNIHVGGELWLDCTRITALPEDLRVGSHLSLHGTRITAEAARHIPDMPGLSQRAKVTGLRSAGYAELARQVEYRHRHLSAASRQVE